MDIQRLRELYAVSPDSPSGVVMAADRRRGSGKKGRPALHTLRNNGCGALYYGGAYVETTSQGKVRHHLSAHRVVFALTYGYWPETVDHIDGDTLNNNPLNLRAATAAQQQANKGVSRRSVTGLRGVYYRPEDSAVRPYRAMCKGKYLGIFHTPEEAHAAYQHAAAEAYGGFNRATR